MELFIVAGFVGLLAFGTLFVVRVINGGAKKSSTVGMAVCFVAVLLGALGASGPSEKSKDTTDNSKEPSQSVQTLDPIEDETGPNTEAVILDESLDTSAYMKFDSEVLFEYGKYFGGEKVVTVISAYQPGSDIKARTANNDSFFHSLIFEFENEEIPQKIKEGDVLTIAGTIQEKPSILDVLEFLETPTVTIENCSIIGYGEIAQELKDGAAEQQAVGAQRKAEFEAQIAAAKKAERDNYVAQCQNVDYNDVARNPDNYDGAKIKITGKVVQVAEGFFDSVTLRIDCGGNMWYVTYSREEGESRILEGDRITGYGECDGVTSYTTVLGSQVTIPSMKMEYYD